MIFQNSPVAKPIKKEKDEVQSRMGYSIVNTSQSEKTTREGGQMVYADAPVRIRHKGESKEVIKAVKDR